MPRLLVLSQCNIAISTDTSQLGDDVCGGAASNLGGMNVPSCNNSRTYTGIKMINY